MCKKPLGIKIVAGVWSLYALLGILMESSVIFSYFRIHSRFTLLECAPLVLFVLMSGVWMWLAYATVQLRPRALFWNVFFMSWGVVSFVLELFDDQKTEKTWQIISILLFCYSIWGIIYFLRPQTKALFQIQKA